MRLSDHRALLGSLAVTLLLVACSAPAPAAPTAPAAKPAPTTPPQPAAQQPAAKQPAAPQPATPAPAAPAAKPGPNAALQAVLDGAKKEAGQGTFVIWISSPKLEGTHKELMQAFQKRFELPDFAWEWVPGNSPDQNRRVLAESKTGRFSADVLSGSWAESIALAEANLLEEVAWVDVFGEALPTIREPADRIQVPELHNRMLAMWDTAKVMMFNTEQVKEADVPNTLEGLAEPKWAGRVVLDSNGAVLDILTLKLGREQIVSHTQAILPNRPILTRGSPAAITAIQTGQGAISPNGTISTIEGLKQQGQPIDWKPLTYGIPVQELGMYSVRGASHPNLARLFVAWTVTEGMAILEKHESMGRLSDPNAVGTRNIKQKYPNVEIIAPKTLQELEAQRIVKDQLTEILTQAAR
jgi:iron(III) transport system substrate-binding protein